MNDEKLPENIEIKLKVSTETEATASPWWMIIDPKQQFATNTEHDNQPLHDIASMITGPFFSREAAQNWLDRTRYNFSKNAKVFCDSGCHANQYDTAYKTEFMAARIATKELNK